MALDLLHYCTFQPVSILGAWLYVRNTTHNKLSKLDWTGFISLSIAVTALQLMLDRVIGLIGLILKKYL